MISTMTRDWGTPFKIVPTLPHNLGEFGRTREIAIENAHNSSGVCWNSGRIVHRLGSARATSLCSCLPGLPVFTRRQAKQK